MYSTIHSYINIIQNYFIKYLHKLKQQENKIILEYFKVLITCLLSYQTKIYWLKICFSFLICFLTIHIIDCSCLIHILQEINPQNKFIYDYLFGIITYCNELISTLLIFFYLLFVYLISIVLFLLVSFISIFSFDNYQSELIIDIKHKDMNEQSVNEQRL